MYDAALGRFFTIDPLAEEYSYQSPYVYAHNNPVVLIDWMGMGDPPSSTMDEAYEYINSLSIENSSIWSNISSEDFINNINSNIGNPSGINQGDGTYFCGFAAALSYMAEKDPLGYAKLMVSLYNTGSGRYGDKIFGSSNAIQAAAGTLGNEGLKGNGADQMAFLTMAENYQAGYLNTFSGNYEKGAESSTSWAGTGIGEFRQMMNDFGYNVTVIGSDIYNNGDYFSTVYSALNNSQDAFLFVNSGALKRNESLTNVFGTHYMRINSISPISGSIPQFYNFNMWDYGAWNTYSLTKKQFNSVTYGVGTTNY